MRERKRLETALETQGELGRRAGDIAAYFELAREGEDVSADLKREIGSLRDLADRLETETLLSGDNDQLNAIVTIHPDRKSTRLNSSHLKLSRMPSSA